MVTAPVVPPTTTLRAHDATALPRRSTGSQSKGPAELCSQPDLLKPNELVNDEISSTKCGERGSTLFQTSEMPLSARCFAVLRCELATVVFTASPRTRCTSRTTR
jgi:hypothetical protein